MLSDGSDSRDTGSRHPPMNLNNGPIDYNIAHDPFDDYHSQGFCSAANSTINSTANDSFPTTGLYSGFFFQQDCEATFPAPTQSSTSASSVYQNYHIPPSDKAQAPDNTFAFSTTSLAAHVALQSQSPLNNPDSLYDWLQATGLVLEGNRCDGPAEDTHQLNI